MQTTSRRSAFALFAVMLTACASAADDDKPAAKQPSRGSCPNNTCPDGTITETPVRCPW